MSTAKSKREILRQKREEQKRRQRTTLIIIGLAAIILITGAVLLPKVLLAKTKYKNTDGFSVGDPNAPVTVEEFSNFLCGHCRDFALYIEEDFIKEYAETGKVYFTFVNFPFGSEEAFAAAEATYCAADQNRFYEYKEFLFNYAGYQDAFSDSSLINYAVSAGLDQDEFQNCLLSNTYENAYLEDYAYAQSVGIQGTPTFLINGTTIVSSSELIPTVDALLNE